MSLTRASGLVIPLSADHVSSALAEYTPDENAFRDNAQIRLEADNPSLKASLYTLFHNTVLIRSHIAVPRARGETPQIRKAREGLINEIGVPIMKGLVLGHRIVELCGPGGSISSDAGYTFDYNFKNGHGLQRVPAHWATQQALAEAFDNDIAAAFMEIPGQTRDAAAFMTCYLALSELPEQLL